MPSRCKVSFRVNVLGLFSGAVVGAVLLAISANSWRKSSNLTVTLIPVVFRNNSSSVIREFLKCQVAAIVRIGVETLPPISVMFGHILADGDLVESGYRFEVFDFLLQRQMAVATIIQRIIGIVDIEPAGYSCVDPQKFHEYLPAAYRVQHGIVDVLRNVGREAQGHVETCRVQLLNGRYPGARRACPFVC